eukprot:6953099-Prymnesium_polylepis.5
MEVAQEYAKGGPDNRMSIVFEAQMGMVDRGADISWLSQCGVTPFELPARAGDSFRAVDITDSRFARDSGQW